MKNIIITGGSGLIGSKISQVLSKTYKIIIVDFVKPKIDLSSNPNIIFYKFDLTKNKNFETLLKKIKLKYKNIYGLINSIYPQKFKTEKNILKINQKYFENSISQHIGLFFMTTQKFIKIFSNSKNQIKVINIESIYDEIIHKFEIYKGTNMFVPLDYCVSKRAIITISKYFAKNLKKKNVIVNTLSPGGIIDNQNKRFLKNYEAQCINKGMLNTEDLLSGIYFLLDANNSNYNGQNLVIDDGFTL